LGRRSGSCARITQHPQAARPRPPKRPFCRSPVLMARPLRMRYERTYDAHMAGHFPSVTGAFCGLR
jgi:hypothetical protein